MPIGQLEYFDINTKQWSVYISRLKQYIVLNEIKNELHVALLITAVGDDTYTLMRDLCAPVDPENKTFEELVNIISEYIDPQASNITERLAFRSRSQRPEESVTDYLQGLKQLAFKCNFGLKLGDHLLEQFVFGLADDEVRKQILAKKPKGLKDTIELALSFEPASETDNAESETSKESENESTKSRNEIADINEPVVKPGLIATLTDTLDVKTNPEAPTTTKTVITSVDRHKKPESHTNITYLVPNDKTRSGTVNIFYQFIINYNTECLKHHFNKLGTYDFIGITNFVGLNKHLNDRVDLIDRWTVIQKSANTGTAQIILAIRPGADVRRRHDLELQTADNIWISFTASDRPVHICLVYLSGGREDLHLVDWCKTVESFIDSLEGTVIIFGRISFGAMREPDNVLKRFISKCNFYSECDSFGIVADTVLVRNAIRTRIFAVEGIVPGHSAKEPPLDIKTNV
ncbi:uncharacterized protein LOC142976511 [Anticarsia gemmatalis]|uniref:uncharacterized protein LOC142976511 n=1 Tax=Anticarsia gemmatalis TaxID=129554 RepID=UPI003F7699C9